MKTKEINKELVGYMKMSNGDLVPMYSTDKVWLELKAKLIKKVEEIEKDVIEKGLISVNN